MELTTTLTFPERNFESLRENGYAAVREGVLGDMKNVERVGCTITEATFKDEDKVFNLLTEQLELPLGR